MLTLVRQISKEDSPKSEGSENSDKSDKKLKVLPAGTPYLAKVNGRLVMVRDKHSRTVSMATSLKGDTFEKKPRRQSRVRNLLGEAFGAPTGESIRVRTQSASAAPSMASMGPPVVFPNGVTYVPYSAPLQQQPFAPYYSAAPTPQLLQQPTFAFPAPEPAKTPKLEEAPEPEKTKATEEEKEQLRDIDAHYQKVASKDLHRHSSDPAIKSRVETTAKSTVTVTKHICAQCHRFRSTRYHLENPIKPGEEPVPAFCKKCQRYASPTSSESSGRDRKKKSSRDKKRRPQTKNISIHSEDSYESPRHTHQRQRSNSEQPRARVVFKERIYPRRLPVEHEIEGFGTGSYVRLQPTDVKVDTDHRQSRGRTRQRRYDEEATAYGRDLSPDTNHPDSAYQRYKPVMRGARRGKSSSQRARSPSYRYVEAPAQYGFYPQLSEEELPSGFVEGEPIHDHVYATRIPLRRKSQKVQDRFFDNDQGGSSGPRRREFSRRRQENKVPSRMPSLDDEHESLNSSHSFKSSSRQPQRECRNEYIAQSREKFWRPRPTERVVIEETIYTSGTGQEYEAEQNDERSSAGSFHPQDRTQTFQDRHEAASHYNDDWGSRTTTKPPSRRTYTGYRRDRYQDSELGPSEASYDHRHQASHDIPRAPTPPSRAPSSARESRQAPEYPFDSESNLATRRGTRDRNGKAPHRYHSPDENYGRRSSTARAFEERAENAVILSPTHSRETSHNYFTRSDEANHRRSYVDGADSESWTESNPHIWDERKGNVNPGDIFGHLDQEPGAWEHQRKRATSFGSRLGEDLFT